MPLPPDAEAKDMCLLAQAGLFSAITNLGHGRTLEKTREVCTERQDGRGKPYRPSWGKLGWGWDLRKRLKESEFREAAAFCIEYISKQGEDVS